jgi:hypothetical protein
MEAASTFETSDDNYFPRQYISEDNPELFITFAGRLKVYGGPDSAHGP